MIGKKHVDSEGAEYRMIKADDIQLEGPHLMGERPSTEKPMLSGPSPILIRLNSFLTLYFPRVSPLDLTLISY